MNINMFINIVYVYQHENLWQYVHLPLLFSFSALQHHTHLVPSSSPMHWLCMVSFCDQYQKQTPQVSFKWSNVHDNLVILSFSNWQPCFLDSSITKIKPLGHFWTRFIFPSWYPVESTIERCGTPSTDGRIGTFIFSIIIFYYFPWICLKRVNHLNCNMYTMIFVTKFHKQNMENLIVIISTIKTKPGNTIIITIVIWITNNHASVGGNLSFFPNSFAKQRDALFNG